jgi:hypothetical protein
MLTLHIVYDKGGWFVKFSLDDPASVLIEQKAEAIKQRIASRQADATILLYERDGTPPRTLQPKKPRTYLIAGFRRNGPYAPKPRIYP